MNDLPQPMPLTDLRRRVSQTRKLIRDALTDLIGPVVLREEFYREWNGCWKVRATVTQPVCAQIEFTLLETPDGAILALPRPLPERWRVETGIRASDDTRWTLDRAGKLVPFPAVD